MSAATTTTNAGRSPRRMTAADAMKDQLQQGRRILARRPGRRIDVARRHGTERRGGTLDRAADDRTDEAGQARHHRDQARNDREEAVWHVLRRHQPRGLHQADDLSRRQVSWVTFEAATGGLVTVQLRHIVAIYDEQGVGQARDHRGRGAYPEGHHGPAGRRDRLQRRGRDTRPTRAMIFASVFQPSRAMRPPPWQSRGSRHGD